MLEYYWIAIFLILIAEVDIASVASRLEMYKGLKILSGKGIDEIPLELYSSICFYLIPDAGIVKFSRRFPLTYLFDRKIKNILKDKTYEGQPVLEILESIDKIKWKDIKDKAIFAVLPKADRDKITDEIS